MYDLIIFDCDGTLVDSEYLNNRVSSELLIEFGLTDYTTEKCIAEFTGCTWTDIKNLLEKRHDVELPQDFISTYIARVHHEMETNLTPVNGAMELVKKCHQASSVCVGSNGERKNVIDSLKLCGFAPNYFYEANIFTRIQVPNGKPAPDLFLYAAEKMNVDPARCLVIEDSPTGVQAGVAAGMEVWGFTGVAHARTRQEKILKKAGAAAVFDRLIHMSEKLGI